MTDKPINLKPRYFAPKKGEKAMFHDWPKLKGQLPRKPVIDPEEETEEEGLARIERKMAAEMEDAEEQARYMADRSW